MKKLILLSLIFTIFFIQPSYADAGIPLWGLGTASSLIASAGLMISRTDFFVIEIIFTIISLGFVVGIETYIIFGYLKKINFKRIFRITLGANLISTLLGCALVLLPLILFTNIHKLDGSLKASMLGPWFMIFNGFGIFICHILLFVLSYIVEYKFFKKILKQEYTDKQIKRAILIANVASYIIMPILIYLTIGFVPFLSLLLVCGRSCRFF